VATEAVPSGHILPRKSSVIEQQRGHASADLLCHDAATEHQCEIDAISNCRNIVVLGRSPCQMSSSSGI